MTDKYTTIPVDWLQTLMFAVRDNDHLDWELKGLKDIFGDLVFTFTVSQSAGAATVPLVKTRDSTPEKAIRRGLDLAGIKRMTKPD